MEDKPIHKQIAMAEHHLEMMENMMPKMKEKMTEMKDKKTKPFALTLGDKL
jgi:hypothetical protein